MYVFLQKSPIKFYNFHTLDRAHSSAFISNTHTSHLRIYIPFIFSLFFFRETSEVKMMYWFGLLAKCQPTKRRYVLLHAAKAIRDNHCAHSSISLSLSRFNIHVSMYSVRMCVCVYVQSLDIYRSGCGRINDLEVFFISFRKCVLCVNGMREGISTPHTHNHVEKMIRGCV